MMKFIRFIVAYSLLAIIAPLAHGQHSQFSRDVTAVNPMSPIKTGYNVLVYEYENVDIRPKFPGGERGMINFINETREYPYNAYKQRIQGRVLCSFVVGTDGKLYDIQVIRSSGHEMLDREAMRVISKMPRWSVGKIDNTKVNVHVVLPISFRL